MHGLVIKCTGSSCVVRTDDGTLAECLIKGNFRIRGIKSTNPVAVGDYVTISQPEQGEKAFITEIGERRNYIVRRSPNLSRQSHILACNLDQCLLVITIRHPETFTEFIDRFLATAQAYRIPVVIVINKTDLHTAEDSRKAGEICNLYTGIGYRCLMCSMTQGTGTDELRELLKDKVTLVSGNSGVGKSTIINTLLPGLELRTGRISDKHDTGMHTTTFSEMFNLPEGGWIIDTPGVKGFGSFNMGSDEISHYFPEIFSCSCNCRYGNCTHTTEPGCAVKDAVSTGKIHQSRYNSYLSMLNDESQGKYRKEL